MRRGIWSSTRDRPELLKRWLGARGWSLEVCDIDLKVGGAYRYVWRGTGKSDVGMYGVHREIVPPERIVARSPGRIWDAGETLVTTVLVEQGGKTTLTATVLFASQEVRDAVLKSGMKRGADDSYDKLAELLASIA